MRRFRYGADPVCLAACAAYLVNRLVIPDAWKGGFLHHHFNDLLLIPAALPWILWVQRRLGTRKHDQFPSCWETSAAFILWSIAAELLAPMLSHRATADPWDVAAYAGGAIVATLWWQSR